MRPYLANNTRLPYQLPFLHPDERGFAQGAQSDLRQAVDRIRYGKD